jgi:succinyl-CoA synthetase beta subunit
VARSDPSAIAAVRGLPIDVAPDPSALDCLLDSMGLEGRLRSEGRALIEKMVRLFQATDATLIEANPVAVTGDDRLVCLDAKLGFDDNAEFRQQKLFSMRDLSQEDPREVEASAHGLNYVGLDGSVGCIVNGAGLAMATMDIVKLHGGSPANFLDVGGAATAEQVSAAISLLLADRGVRAILVNIFGGIVRCDTVAEGIVSVLKLREGKTRVPIVLRLLGTNSEIATDLVRKSGVPVISESDLDEAARRVVILSQISELAEKASVRVEFGAAPTGGHST